MHAAQQHAHHSCWVEKKLAQLGPRSIYTTCPATILVGQILPTCAAAAAPLVASSSSKLLPAMLSTVCTANRCLLTKVSAGLWYTLASVLICSIRVFSSAGSRAPASSVMIGLLASTTSLAACSRDGGTGVAHDTLCYKAEAGCRCVGIDADALPLLI